MADLAFCARYPFTKEAKDYVSSAGVQLTGLLIEKAEKRVQEALETGKIKKVAQLPEAQEEELAVYAASRMIVAATSNRYIASRYCIAEAKRAGEYLGADTYENVQKVAAEMGITFETADQGGFRIPFWQYLSFSPKSYDYKLSNRRLKAGWVWVSRHEQIRILEEAIRKRMEETLPLKVEVAPQVKKAAERILKLVPRLEMAITKISQENYPPCIRKLIEDLAMNINVSHTGRVALAIYLTHAGLSVEKIVDLFRHAPDFSEKTTRYQVDYIRSKKYSMPSCSTMDGYGLCIADCRCGNPLLYKDSIHGARLRKEERE
ncbi:MAG: DNA primase large subunit PriL [Candidatus Anstonellaceae archaeon]